MGTPVLHGVYLLLDEQWSPKFSLVQVIETAVSCGVRIFQYRNKTDSMRDCYLKAKALRKAASHGQATFLVNDRCDLALALDADGVHLGQDDLPLELAREILGTQKIIGMSTHRPEEVELATAAGADYIGFGPIFPTTTKRDHEPVVGIQGLQRIRALTNLPIFAIGGLTVDSMPSIRQAGGDGVAVASVVYRSVNMETTFHDLVKSFSEESPEAG